MKKLALAEWASIAEIIGSIVVVVTLIVIGLELRQNTNALYSSSWQQVLDKLIDLDVTEGADAELAEIMRLGELHPERLSDAQRWRFDHIAQARLGQLEYAYLSKANGTLDDYHWGAMEGYLSVILCKPGYARFWNEVGREVYHQDFFAFVEANITASCLD